MIIIPSQVEELKEYIEQKLREPHSPDYYEAFHAMDDKVCELFPSWKRWSYQEGFMRGHRACKLDLLESLLEHPDMGEKSKKVLREKLKECE